ncbi:unnamed protein product [Cylindrotheca closterium]|uniref:SAP domain-containing protein n=1 Tax=Cylindrotheca closterium TaxID=2856 RepID=A0AAD2CYD4_9STRA|nr:unnamed protein product [Cylindrotheca closterium]
MPSSMFLTKERPHNSPGGPLSSLWCQITMKWLLCSAQDAETSSRYVQWLIDMCDNNTRGFQRIKRHQEWANVNVLEAKVNRWHLKDWERTVGSLLVSPSVEGVPFREVSAVGRSNVNLETWNNVDAGDIGFQAMNARLAHGNIKDNNNNATTTTTTTTTTRTTIRQEDNGLKILPKGQILASKVPELKEACAKRGLLKMGNKADLQDRLLDWSAAQQQKQKQRKQQPPKDFVAEWFDDEDDDDDEMLLDEDEYSIRSNEMEASAKSPNSLEEWSRTVDLESLRKKRREIHRLKRQGSIPPASKKQQEEQQQRLRNRHADLSLSSSKEYLQNLKKTLETPSSQYSSNVRAKEIYMVSKHVDQAGDQETSIQLLQTLLTVTPNDGRVYCR